MSNEEVDLLKEVLDTELPHSSETDRKRVAESFKKRMSVKPPVEINTTKLREEQIEAAASAAWNSWGPWSNNWENVGEIYKEQWRNTAIVIAPHVQYYQSINLE